MEKEFPDRETSGEKNDRWPALIWLCVGNFAFLLLMARLVEPFYPGLPTEGFDSTPIFVSCAAIALLMPPKPANRAGWVRIGLFVLTIDTLAFLAMFALAAFVSARDMTALGAGSVNLLVGLIGFGAVFAYSSFGKIRKAATDHSNNEESTRKS